MHWRETIATVLFLIALAPTTATACDKRVCVTTQQHDGGVDFAAVNTTYATISLRLTFELQNMRSASGLEQRFVLEPQSTTSLTSADVVERGKAWRYSYNFNWRLGDHTTTHSERTKYILPVAAGSKVRITQGCNGMLSHKGRRRFATDIDLAVGTPIHAARGGTVVYLKDDSTKGGPSKKFLDDANEIMIEHDDRTIGTYAHLKHKGVEVKLGDRIAAGQRIGLSGNTGWSTGPHLHFEVWKPDAQMRMDSIAVSFDTTAGPVRCPKERYLTARGG